MLKVVEQARGAIAAAVACALLTAARSGAQTEPGPTRPAAPSGILRGVVRDSATLAAIQDARVSLVGTKYTAASRADGGFSLPAIPPGTYDLHIVRIGFRAAVVHSVAIAVDGTTDLGPVYLSAVAVPLATVQVTPGSYGVMESQAGSRQTLSREDIETKPQIGEDIFRAVNRLPGLAASDVSAKFFVRGGAMDEILVTLDGTELYEPFHLKDVDAALSIVDVNAIGGIDLSTGGFSAESGNHLTGLFAMRSMEPTNDGARTSFGLSVTNVRGASQGTFDNGRWAWFVAARRGYLDLALKLAQASDSLSPTFDDAFAKLEFNPSATQRVALHALVARDALHYEQTNDPSIDSQYGSGYAWATWDALFSDRAHASTVASWSRLTWDRVASQNIGKSAPTTMLNFADHRSFDALSVRQDWTFTLGARAVLRAGAEAKQESARYDYSSLQRLSGATVVDTTTAAASPDGTTAGAYVTQRVRLGAFIADAGARIDRATYGVAETAVSPRAALAWSANERTVIRAAWGRYVQPEPIFALQAQDGVTQFYPSSVAEHRVIGLEQRLGDGMTARAEVYDRRITRERPQFVNALNRIETLPEVASDRVRIDPASGDARGIEMLLTGAPENQFTWSASYALARATDRLGGVEVPRVMDQRHSLNLDATYRPAGGRWLLSAGWLYNSGRPNTPDTLTADTTVTVGANGARTLHVTLGKALGALYSQRLPSYQRLDLRATRFIDWGSQRLTLFVDVFNALNHDNPRGYFYRVQSSPPQLTRSVDTQLPILPTVGITWAF